ncbi:hypothetical protein ABFV74_19365, partial [Pseudoalteromonas distincta]|uniref:hypothetical protein n=1 Tax=Pseudoalteromonas distincta TaxID=77608 RepID=UPI0032183DB4
RYQKLIEPILQKCLCAYDKSMSDDDRLDHRLIDIQRLVYKRQVLSLIGNKKVHKIYCKE